MTENNVSIQELSSVQKDRAIGALLGLACGDALGAGLEFKPRVPYTTSIGMNGGGNWEPGEYTDDTAMAVGIAEVASRGVDLLSTEGLNAIARNWLRWSTETKDIGIQTSQVFTDCGLGATAEQMRASAIKIHERTGKSAGNGSLMRTAPVALAYLDDENKLVEAARAISELTHCDETAGDACVIWCLAIRHCVLTGKLPDLRQFLSFIPQTRQLFWRDVIDQAESAESHSFENNGWVISALQAAWSAIVNSQIPADRPDLRLFPAQHFEIALERAARCGNDTDTVAAIAGQILGARWGLSAIPLQWRRLLHGWPGYGNRDLIQLAALTIQKGKSDSAGWPSIDVVNDSHWVGHRKVSLFAYNMHITVGGHGALHNPPAGMSAAISLCRVGTSETSLPPENHLQVMLMDKIGPDENQNLPYLFDQIGQAIGEYIKTTGHTVVHCVQAQSRTPSAMIAWLMSYQGHSFHEAFEIVRETLPEANPNPDFIRALKSLEHNFKSKIQPEEVDRTTYKDGPGNYRLLEEGTFYKLQNKQHFELKYEGPFGTLFRVGGAWIDEYQEETRFDDAQKLEIVNSSTSEAAKLLVMNCDEIQFSMN